MTTTEPDTTTETDTELAELMKFVEEHPELDDDKLIDELENRCSREAINAFTAAFTGITPTAE